MIQLPHGCTASEISVYPKNWKTVSASVKKDWYIQYYFRDPVYPQKIYGKLVIRKGMNKFKTVAERKEVTRGILEDEIKLLYEGYNPFLDAIVPPVEINYEIEPTTPFIKALQKAQPKLKVSAQTIMNIKSALKYIEKASDLLGYSKIEVQNIKRKNISYILDNCHKIKDYWSAALYNHYRSYLMMLFRKLVQLEAIDSNPVNKDLPIEQEEINLKDLITPEERDLIENHFKDDKYYLRFLHILFHSGSRPIELLRLKDTAIGADLLNFKIKVIKRKKIIEEQRPIKKISKNDWQEILTEINDQEQSGIYLFGKDLKPGKVQCKRDYVTKKWQREVKIKLKINKDLYRLKHSNLDETSAILDAKAAARQAGHQSTVITLKHYLVNESERRNNELREVNNPFSQHG